MLPKQLVTPSLSFESTTPFTSSLTSRHTLCLFHSCLLLLILLLLVPLCSMLVCMYVAMSLHALLLAPRLVYVCCVPPLSPSCLLPLASCLLAGACCLPLHL
jgi:hypothetical protein